MATEVNNTETTSNDFCQKIYQEIVAEDVFLPILPEVAISMRRALNTAGVTINRLAEEIQKDQAVSAKLIQVANSAYYARAVPVNTIAGAVSRLGLFTTYNLAMAITASNLFHTNSDYIKEKMQQAHMQSVQTSSLSHAIAGKLPGLDPEKALLHGLFANIGEIPVLVYSNENPELFASDEELDDTIRNLRGPLGEWILGSWQFETDFIETVRQCDQLDRKIEKINYSAVASAAILLNRSIFESELDIQQYAVIQCLKEAGVDLTNHYFIQEVSDDVADLELVLSGKSI